MEPGLDDRLQCVCTHVYMFLRALVHKVGCGRGKNTWLPGMFSKSPLNK